MRPLNLKSKMALAVSALFLLFLGSFTAAVLTYFERELTQSICAQQDALVTAIAADLDSRLRFSNDILTATAKKLDRRLIGSPDAVQRYLDDQVSALLTFDNGLFLFSASGRIIAESPFIDAPDRRGRDISFREYFRETVRTGKPYISAPYVSTHTPGHPAVMVTAPLFDGSGRLMAVLGGSIDLLGRNFIKDLQNFSIGRSGYLFLFNTRRTMIMHHDGARIMKNDIPPGANRMLDRAIAGFDGSGETVNSRGVRVISSYRHLRSTDWIVGASYPVAEAYAPVYRARRYLVTAMAGGAVLAMLFVWLLMKRLTRPLTEFARHVDGMPAKEGDARLVALDGTDEIGVLARSFNDMVEELDRRQLAFVDSEVKYHGLFQAVPDAVIIGDLESGRVTEANEAACSLYGYSREEFMQLQPGDLCADPDSGARALARRARVLLHRTHRRKDGTHLTVDVSLNYVPSGSHPFFIAAVRDVADQVRAEEEIRALNAELERRVAERTDELFASNRELEAFCYSVSHDLRAPLRSISGFSSLLAEDCGTVLNDECRGHLERIDAAARRMGNLIDDLLALSRVTRGEMLFEPVDLTVMADELLAELAQLEPERRVMTVVAPRMVVTGDSRLLWTMMQNLLGNAWKFTSRNPRARIEFGCRMEKGETVYFVRDNGAGFDMAYRAKLFKPFQRLHRQDQFPGTGIGLATVQRVVIRHGGRIWCDSAPGYGAVFFFTLGSRSAPGDGISPEDRAGAPHRGGALPPRALGICPAPWS